MYYVDEVRRRFICCSGPSHKAIGDQLTCIFVDHGLLRKGEGDMVMEQFGEGFNMNIIRVNAKIAL